MPEFHDRRTGDVNEVNSKSHTLVTHGIKHPSPEYAEGALDEYSLAPSVSYHDSMEEAHRAAGDHNTKTGFATTYEVLDSKAHPLSDPLFSGRTDYPGTSKEDFKKISQRPSWG